MKNEDSRKYKKAFSDSLLIIFFTVMPSLSSLFLISFGISNKPYTSLYEKGDFFLYSISFLGSAYVIYKQLNHDLFKDYGNLIITLLFIVSVAYSAASSDSLHKALSIILTLSVIFLIVSVILLFFSQVVSNKESAPDVRAHRNNEQNKIEDALN